MTVQIEVSPEVARMLETLREKATALNLTLEAYLQRIIQAVTLLQSNGQNLTGMERSAAQPRNEAMFAVLQRSAERMKDVPVTGSTEETLRMIREARAGAMWGYEPLDTDTD
jgi:hypothetical protein